ncbi:MAG: amidohydrolase family protein [Planctomycetota bacterium]
MALRNSVELLTLNLKLLGKQTRKNVLLSTGDAPDKQALLPAIRRLLALPVDLYATPGTHTFLAEHDIASTEVHKITDGRAPNILTLLKSNSFDLIVNILTGQVDYDEQSDAKLIRSLAIENGIPLVTDVEVAQKTIEQVVIDTEKGTYRYKLADDEEPWNLHLRFLDRAAQLGGLANHHAHFDKAYLISYDNLKLSQVDMQKKWELYKYLKENYTLADLTERIARGLDKMIDQGATYCRTMVDADATVKLLPIKAALRVKEMYADKIRFEVGIQPLQGVLEEDSWKVVQEACEMADYVGGLPSKDRPTPEKHIDRIFALANKLDKPVDVHVDQENNPREDETELLARKTIEHGLQGKVQGVHSVSLAAKSEAEQDRIIQLCLDADMGIIICPSAAISMKQLDMTAPLHNSIAPFPKLHAAGVRTYLGVDNIHDLFMPMVDGDLWTEARMLMEACRFYDVDAVTDWACRPPVTQPTAPATPEPVAV